MGIRTRSRCRDHGKDGSWRNCILMRIGGRSIGLSGDPGLPGEDAFAFSALCFLSRCLCLCGAYQKLVFPVQQNNGPTHGQGHQSLLCFW